jgi:hypothetical protein
MKLRQEMLFLCFALLAGSLNSLASTAEKTREPEDRPALSAQQGEWVFSGTVTNESGERYNYYFQMDHKGKRFNALATLINSQTKAVLLFEESTAVIAKPDLTNWHVGSAFLQFNPINNSWVFGIKSPAKGGFNFKADMLSTKEHSPVVQTLRSGIELLVNQTGRLNGHVQIGDGGTEEFVTGKKAWFKQIWTNKDQQGLHPFTVILCQFDDGSGFYAVNLEEAAYRGAVAGWRNHKGVPVSMSPIVGIKEAEKGRWSISVASPRLNLLFDDALVKEGQAHQLIAGITQQNLPGFCTISKDKFEHLSEIQSDYVS